MSDRIVVVDDDHMRVEIARIPHGTMDIDRLLEEDITMLKHT